MNKVVSIDARTRRDALVEQHIEWARNVATKVASRLPTWFTPEDLTGPASIALLDAATKFDPSRKIPFRAYAIRQVEGACYSAARRNEYRERAHAELTDEIAEGGHPATSGFAPSCEATKQEVPELPEQVWQLPPEQFRVVQLVYSHELTVEAAASRMGISPSKASQHHRAALQTLRELMGKAA